MKQNTRSATFSRQNDADKIYQALETAQNMKICESTRRAADPDIRPEKSPSNLDQRKFSRQRCHSSSGILVWLDGTDGWKHLRHT